MPGMFRRAGLEPAVGFPTIRPRAEAKARAASVPWAAG